MVYIYIIKQRRQMETIKSVNGYKIKFNGGKTYLVVDSANQCRFATTSLKKAENHLNQILKSVNA